MIVVQLGIVLEKKKKHYRVIYLIDNTDISSFGFGRRPDRRTTISNDQYSKLYISNCELIS